MNKHNLNMNMIKKHIDKATPKKWSRKEKLILTLETITILLLFALFGFLFLISDILEAHLLA